MRVLRSLTAGIVLLAVIVIPPAVLLTFAGNILPTSAQINGLLQGLPDYGGELFWHTAMPLAAWVLWAWFAVPILWELFAQLRGVRAPSLKAFGPTQALAASLVGAALLSFSAGPAMAATQTSSAGPSAAPTTISATLHAETPGKAATAAKTTTSVQGHQYVTVSRDTLWGLAEKVFGDGSRYPEIVKMNQEVLGENPDFLPTGVTLTLPEHAKTALQQHRHVVVDGENLTGIASLHGVSVDALVHANLGTPQPDGGALVNQDHISAGWVLQIPNAAEAPAPASAPSTKSPAAKTPEHPSQVTKAPAATHKAPPAATQAPAAPKPAEKPSSTPGVTFSESASPAEQPSPAPAASAAEESEDVVTWPAFTFGGIGVSLAVGLLTVLGRRRLMARKRRTAGQQPVEPSPEAESLELELRTVEEPADIASMDAAFRMLGAWATEQRTALPELFCSTVGTSGVVVYLMAPAELPKPFVKAAQDGTVWTIDRAEIDFDNLPDGPAPYPALAALGRKDDENLFLELENVGALHLSSPDPDLAAQVMTALACDLACSTWGEQLRITMVGLDASLPQELAPGRVTVVEDLDTLIEHLKARAKQSKNARESLGARDLYEARAITESDWEPEVLLLGLSLTEQQRTEISKLAAAVPRLGIAAVSTDALEGPWRIDVEATSAVLHPVGLEFTPQKVSHDEAELLLESLRTADAEPLPSPHEEVELTADDIPAAEPHLSAVPDVPEAEGTVGPLEDLPPLPPIAVETIARLEGQPVENPTPLVLVLGDLKVLDPAGEPPYIQGSTRVSPGQTERCTAMVAYLALHPGATSDAVHKALWGAESVLDDKARKSRNKLSHNTRVFLGKKPDGTHWYPEVGAAGYRLDDEIRTDWHIFNELIGPDLKATPDSHLVAALLLVRGAPFGGAKGKNIGWADVLAHKMRTKICNAAHELAVRSLKAGNLAQARLASTIGRMVDPIQEQAWRDSLLVEHASGNPEGVEELVSKLEAFLAEVCPEEPEPEGITEELIADLRRRSALAS